MEFELVHSYTRAQAIADGVLVDVTATAKEVGFAYRVALTRAVFNGYVTVPEGVECQDKAGRLWDVLWMTRLAVRANPDGRVATVRLLVRNDNRLPRPVQLKAVCGPDDDVRPCITIMLPDED
jgi:hypothetical protein